MLLGELETALDELESEHAASTHEPEYSGAKIIPAILNVREAADQLETIVPDDLWPLPTYQEMLFIK